ncbi:hypothetical protein O181_119554 [Austropuccinia psidii MF-1]|uniref:Uncharacterized protein n=1 Tax=Austropuccinia psidii MF-1 TaxID=1389203 RepID=A0A9Q3KEV8_9BASI|nr:hypothetical protein [Austropuccinia psidii MF-1]
MRLRHCSPSLSSPLLMPSKHAPDTAYHPYSHGVPSRHHSSLCLCSALPTCSRHCLPSLRLWSALLTCCRHCLPSLRSRGALPTCSQHCLPSLRFQSALPTLLILMLPYYIHSVRWLVGVYNECNC